MSLRVAHMPWLIGAAIVLICASFASLFFMAHQAYRLNLLFEQSYWAAAQSESEFLRLRNALELYVAGAPDASYDDMRLKLDILYSRIDVVESGHTQNVAGGSERTAMFTDRMMAMIDALDVLTADPAFRDGPDGARAVQLMRDEWIPLHDWVREILHGQLWIGDRKELAEWQQTIIVVNAVLVILSIAVVTGILIQNHRVRALASREVSARAKAEHAAMSRDRFVAGMSHELRTPLNAIIGFCDLLKMGLHGRLSNDQASYVSNISDSGHHLLSLINDVLDYSKLEANMHEPEMTQVDLREVIEEAIQFIEPTFVVRGGTVDLQVPDGSVWIYSDRRMTLQCAVNLLSNAAKFSDRDGTIEVSIGENRGLIQLSIRDHGPGMTELELETVFEPFRQAHDPYTTNIGGTGLGLSLTRSFCTLIGAELKLQSQPGEGLEATIEFLPEPKVGRPTVSLESESKAA